MLADEDPFSPPAPGPMQRLDVLERRLDIMQSRLVFGGLALFGMLLWLLFSPATLELLVWWLLEVTGR